MNGGDSKNPGYAATIASPPSLSKPPKGYGCPIIQARTTTHNGMPAVIFEVKDYYRFMAEEYKLTIVDRCYFQRRVEKFLLGSTYSRRLEVELLTFAFPEVPFYFVFIVYLVSNNYILFRLLCRTLVCSCTRDSKFLGYV
ncbi:PREDICTED: uncharacterized protein LOC109214314 isoform X1 [Nicotiana attenuata]|uniref:uncharacterized protein LOC109214314 isoform X1 n=1 Tax=Nicotiana attenuata TaxID=49451 RepID=UPI000904DB2C|nr:PREDICTED: uncharacterized protein LOC109214314 isoform X1 [Nicotiana attenuata]